MKAKTNAAALYLGICLLLRAEKQRYGGLAHEIENKFLYRHKKYRINIASAYNLLVNWHSDLQTMATYAVRHDGVTFINIARGDPQGATIPSLRHIQKDITQNECYNCHKMGHYTSDCPLPQTCGQSSVQMLMASFAFDKFHRVNDHF